MNHTVCLRQLPILRYNVAPYVTRANIYVGDVTQHSPCSKTLTACTPSTHMCSGSLHFANIPYSKHFDPLLFGHIRCKSTHPKQTSRTPTAPVSTPSDTSATPPLPPEAYWAVTADHKYDEDAMTTWKQLYSNLKEYDKEGLLEWKQAFDAFDRDDDGYISQADLQKNPRFSLEKSKLLKQYDKDQNNLIDFGEFVEAMFHVDVQTVRQNFEGFDAVDIQLEFEKHAVTNPATSKKTLSHQHVKGMMKYYEFTCITEKDVATLFQDMDQNKDGEIDFNDFKKWLAIKG